MSRLEQVKKDIRLLEEEKRRLEETPESLTVEDGGGEKVTVTHRSEYSYPIGIAFKSGDYENDRWCEEGMKGVMFDIEHAEQLVKNLQQIIKLAKKE